MLAAGEMDVWIEPKVGPGISPRQVILEEAGAKFFAFRRQPDDL